MDLCRGFTEECFSEILKSKKKLWIITPTERRRNQLNKLWKEFTRDLSNSDKSSVFNVRFFSPMAFVHSTTETGNKKIISTREQQFLLNQVIADDPRIPLHWKNMPSLSTITRKAYSVREFSNTPHEEANLENLYRGIKFSYLGQLEKNSSIDNEQLFSLFSDNLIIPDDIDLWLEYFPGGTLRYQRLCHTVFKICQRFLIPDPFFPLTGEFIDYGKLRTHIEDQIDRTQLDFNWHIEEYESDLDEVTAQFEWLSNADQSNKKIIMADARNYRSLYEQLSPIFNFRPEPGRIPFSESQPSIFLIILLKTMREPENIEYWLSILNQPMHFIDLDREENIQLKQIINLFHHEVREYSIKGLTLLLENDILSFKRKLVKLFPDKSKEEAAVQIRTVWAKFLKVLRQHFSKTPVLYPTKDFIEILKKNLTLFSPDDNTRSNFRQMNDSLMELLNFYIKYNVVKIKISQFQDQFNNFAMQMTDNYLSFNQPFDLIDIEDAKNMSANGELWISGLSMDAYPSTISENNIFIPFLLRQEITEGRRLEEKAVLWQLSHHYPGNEKISYSRIINGEQKAASLLFNERTKNKYPKSGLLQAVRNRFKDQKELAAKTISASFRSTHFSPTAINAFLKCPRKYFWQHSMGLEKREQYDAQIDAPGLGSFIHSLLENLFSQPDIVAVLMDSGHEEDMVMVTLGNRLSEIITAETGKNRWAKILNDPVNRVELNQWTSGLIDKKAPVGNLSRLLKENIDFIFARIESGQNHKLTNILTEEYLQTKLADFTIGGKLDRIDIYDDNQYYCVWDYKTGTREVLSEELSLHNIQREVYAFLINRNYSPDRMHVLIQPAKGPKLKPLIDFRDNLNKEIHAAFKVDTKKSFQYLKLLYTRIMNPRAVVEYRVDNLPLPEYPDIAELLEGKPEPQQALADKIKGELTGKLDSYYDDSIDFYLWLLERMNQFPYPAIVDSHCSYCDFKSMCDSYWKSMELS